MNTRHAAEANPPPSKKKLARKAGEKSRRAAGGPTGDVGRSSKPDRQASARWTEKLMKKGFTPVSNLFLEKYHLLVPQITPTEVLFILHVLRHKWDERHPYPAFKTIATRMGLSIDSAREKARSLQSKNYLYRHLRQGTTNKFDFSPLFDALEEVIAEEVTSKRTKQRRSA